MGDQAYVDELSRDLAAELAAYGVTVENQAPFYVATKMSKIRKPRLDAPSPKVWVAAALKQARHFEAYRILFWFIMHVVIVLCSCACMTI